MKPVPPVLWNGTGPIIGRMDLRFDQTHLALDPLSFLFTSATQKPENIVWLFLDKSLLNTFSPALQGEHSGTSKVGRDCTIINFEYNKPFNNGFLKIQLGPTHEYTWSYWHEVVLTPRPKLRELLLVGSKSSYLGPKFRYNLFPFFQLSHLLFRN